MLQQHVSALRRVQQCGWGGSSSCLFQWWSAQPDQREHTRASCAYVGSRDAKRTSMMDFGPKAV